MRLRIYEDLEVIGKAIIRDDKRFSFLAYLLHGDRNVLIDTLPDRSASMLIEALQEILGDKQLDAIITNHSEEDHSGALPEVLKVYKGVPVYGTANCQRRLGSIVPTVDFHVVHTGDTLQIGTYNFSFIETTGLHWDDNMVTFLAKQGILFSNDLFGQMAAEEPCLDREYTKEDLLTATEVYYNNVFAAAPLKQKQVLKTIATLPIKLIAPGHGVVLQRYGHDILNYYLNQLPKE